jgi:hypothetical protein
MNPSSVIDSWNRTADALIESTRRALLHDLITTLTVIDSLDLEEGLKVAEWELKVFIALMKIELEQRTEGRMAGDGI